MIEVEGGEIWWADLREPRRSEPGYKRPVVILQADSFNRSHIKAVIVGFVTGNLDLAAVPGNVFITARSSGLNRDSVVHLSQVVTLDRSYLTERVALLPANVQGRIDSALREVLAL